MRYPKEIMRKSELLKIGFPEDFLKRAQLTGKIAWRSDPTRLNSPILYDTQALEKYRIDQMELDNQINNRR